MRIIENNKHFIIIIILTITLISIASTSLAQTSVTPVPQTPPSLTSTPLPPTTTPQNQTSTNTNQQPMLRNPVVIAAIITAISAVVVAIIAAIRTIVTQILERKHEDKKEEVKRSKDTEQAIKSYQSIVSPELALERPPFYGRENEINDVVAGLQNKLAIGVLVYGLGGMGKTELALQVALRCKKDGLFHPILFVTAKTSQLELREEPSPVIYGSLSGILEKIARDLKLDELIRRKPLQTKFVLIGHHFQRFGSQEDVCLIILDNLEALQKSDQRMLLQGVTQWPYCKFIITHRQRPDFASNFATHQIRELGFEHARKIIDDIAHNRKHLREQVSSADIQTLQQLYQVSHGSPLKLKWILKLIEHRKETIRNRIIKIEEGTASTDHDSFVFAQIKDELSARERIILFALSFFNTASLEMLKSALGNRAGDDSELGDSIQVFDEFSLLAVYTDTNISLHSLAHSLISKDLLDDPNGAVYLEIDNAFAWNDFVHRNLDKDETLSEDFDSIINEWHHVKAALDTFYNYATNYEIDPDEDESIYQSYAYDYMYVDMFIMLQGFMLHSGYWDELISYGQKAYEVIVQIEDWDRTYWVAYELAWVYGKHYLNNPEQGELWINRTVEAANRSESKWHIAEAVRLQGLLTYQQGDIARGRQLLEESIHHYQQLSGEYVETDVQLAIARIENDLASIIFESDKSDPTSKGKWEKALYRHKQFSGSKECQSAILGNCGDWYYEQDELDSAWNCYNNQLSLALESGRQDTIAGAYFGLAKVLKKQKKYHEALEQSERAYEIGQRLKHNDFGDIEEQVKKLREISHDPIAGLRARFKRTDDK